MTALTRKSHPYGLTDKETVAVRTFLGFILVIAAMYAALLLFLYLVQHRLIFFPARTLYATPGEMNWAYEDVHFEAPDGVPLHGWYVPAEEARGVLLFFHGNAGNISHRLESIRIFREIGLDVFIFDYRGYGRSGGRLSERGTYNDGLAAWQYLVEERGIDPRAVILFGRSLGGAIAAAQATRNEAGGVILESTFTSIPDMGARHYPWIPVRLLSRYRYETAGQMADIRIPVLIAHSAADEIIPFEHGRILYERANEPKHFLEMRGGHNDGFVTSGTAYVDGLRRFVDTVLR